MIKKAKPLNMKKILDVVLKRIGISKAPCTLLFPSISISFLPFILS